MEKNRNLETNLILFVDLSLGKDFKESVVNCMDFMEVIKKEYSCNCTLKVNVEQDSGSYSQRLGIDECEKIGERILKD